MSNKPGFLSVRGMEASGIMAQGDGIGVYRYQYRYQYRDRSVG